MNSPRYRMSWIQLYTLFWMDQRSFQTFPSNVEKSAVLNFWDERERWRENCSLHPHYPFISCRAFFFHKPQCLFLIVCSDPFHCSYFEFVSDPYTVCFQHNQWHKNSYSWSPKKIRGRKILNKEEWYEDVKWIDWELCY